MDQIWELTPVPTAVLSSSFTIVQVSESYLRLTGLASEDCIGHSVEDTLHARSADTVIAFVQQAINTAKTTRNAYTTKEVQVGNCQSCEIRVTPIFKQESLLYVVLELQDTTEEHQGSMALDATNETYRILVESVIGEDSITHTILTEVIDTGISVPTHAVDSLFKQYTHFDASPTKRYQGTGLGFSICRSLAESMGGACGFRQNPDRRGSVFWFTVKVAKMQNAELMVDGEVPSFEAPPHQLASRWAPGKSQQRNSFCWPRTMP